MKIVALVRSELKRLTASSLARLAFVALMTVPLLYGGMYLWANQNPYAKLDHIPAAIVNSDAGATDSDGNAVNYGDKVEKTLVDGKSFDWHVVSASQAASGLKAESYNFVFTIPSSFSRDLTSASTTDPTPAKIHLTTNDTTSYLSSTIADQAGNTIRAAVTAEVGKTAAKTLLVGLNDVRSNLQTATSGAQDLENGSKKLKSGLDSASTGATTLSTGLSQLSSGAGSLNSGLQTLKTQTAALPSQTQKLAVGAGQVAAGNKALNDKVATAASTADSAAGDLSGQLAAAQQAQRQALDALAQQAGLTNDQKTAVGELLAGANEKAATQLTTAVNDAKTQLDALHTATQQLDTGSAQVSAGAATLASSAPALTSGISQAADGASTLASKTSDAAAGASTLSSGLKSLDSGAGSLADGSATLATKLGDGVKKIPATTAATRDKQAAAIADPVSIKDSSIASAGNYGAGLAPFFISLAAWIGMYALFLIIKPISKRAITAIKAPGRITLAGWLTPVVLGVVQMVALFAIVKFALGFDVHDWPGMIAVMVLASATFAAIIMMLNVWLGSVGQFLGLVLMLIQLVTAGGTFPWQTLPGPLAALHFALPMSYAVDGIRQLMYGGSMAAAGHDALVLGLWLLGALLLTFVAARRMTRSRTLRDLRPSLIG